MQPSADPEAQAIEAVGFTSSATARDRKRMLIKAQVILDRAHFSPGVIDGRDGGNFRHALAAYASAHAIPAPSGGGLDETAWRALSAADGGPVTQDYVITAADVKGPFLASVPKSMAAMARLKSVGYTSVAEALAERFHMDEALLRAMNPDTNFSTVGASIVVVRPSVDPLPAVARLEVDKTHNAVRAYDAAGKLVGYFPATVGSAERPAPSGEWTVTAVAPHPDYTYDPTRLTFGDASKGKLTIPPGPNNPVGATWIALSAPTYGIHGSPDPTRIGKVASHGCVRLTNWDAVALGKAVRKGVGVLFVGDQKRKA